MIPAREEFTCSKPTNPLPFSLCSGVCVCGGCLCEHAWDIELYGILSIFTLYCTFVVLLVPLASPSVISYYSYIQLLMRARSCVLWFDHVYIVSGLASLKSSFQTSVHFRCYTPVNVPLLSFVFICSSFQHTERSERPQDRNRDALRETKHHIDGNSMSLFSVIAGLVPSFGLFWNDQK